jgi:hypothetical protein
MDVVYRSRNPIKSLRVFIDERVGRPLGAHDVVYVLKTAAREILPAAGLSGRCPQLEIFAHWVVHHELDRSLLGDEAIAMIAEAFPLHGYEGRDEKWLEEQVNDGISFAKLRLDLIAVCRRFEVSEEIFSTWDAWRRFALPLAEEVSGKPVRVGQRSKMARERIENAGLPLEHRPQSVSLLHVEDPPARINGWFWEVQLPTGRVLVQLLLGGFRQTDFPVPLGWQSPL